MQPMREWFGQHLDVLIVELQELGDGVLVGPREVGEEDELQLHQRRRLGPQSALRSRKGEGGGRSKK